MVTQLVDHKQCNNKVNWVNRLRSSTINQRLAEQYKKRTLCCEGRGGAAPGDTLNKALQTLFGKYYFLYFRRCENMVLSD